MLGIIALDLAVQELYITNQSVIYCRRPEARNRLTSYIISHFASGAFGSLVFATAYQAPAGTASASATCFCLINLLLWLCRHEESGLPRA